MIQKAFDNARKIVIKIGTNTLSKKDGTIDMEFFHDFAKQIDFLRQQGKQLVLVSSGARIAGASFLKKWSRATETSYKQALCSIGQVLLMNSYLEAFLAYEIKIGQVLLTRDDLDSELRHLHIRNTVFTLVDEGIIPIINENDSVSVEEIKIGDNDTLAARVAHLWNADLMVLLSDIDGVYDKNPSEYPNAQLLEHVYDLEHEMNRIETGNPGNFGTGGIKTKLEAARIVNRYGIPMILTNGKKKGIIQELFLGNMTASLFHPEEESPS
jgi:glutamate 5-kinase